PLAARADVVGDWNAQLEALAAQGLGNVAAARTGAILNVAIFEAVNSIVPRYRPYRLALPAQPEASREAAAAGAGHEVLATLFPDQRPQFDAVLAQALIKLPNG